MYAVTDPIVKRDCEEDADEATGAESSIDEGEDAGPGEVSLSSSVAVSLALLLLNLSVFP